MHEFWLRFGLWIGALGVSRLEGSCLIDITGTCSSSVEAVIYFLESELLLEQLMKLKALAQTRLLRFPCHQPIALLIA